MNEDQYIDSLLDIPEELYEEEFTPMEDRLKGTDLEVEFKLLREKVEEEDFERYFNGLIHIKRHQKDLLMITYSERHRAVIYKMYIEILKEVFDVKNIMIMVQSR